jgi:sarcosine oxidase, subunit gamma
MLEPLIDPCSILRVQTWDSQAPAPAKVEQALGVVWPHDSGAVACGRAAILCIGPTDWLVIASDPDAAALLDWFEEAFEGSAFRATNVSQALARIKIDGPAARLLLAKGCSLDLHPPRFAPGRCTRTRLAGMPVIVRCTQPSTFECIVTSSYGDYLLSWLADAATEFANTPITPRPSSPACALSP